MSRASLAMPSAFPHEFRFSIDTISGAALWGTRGHADPLQDTPPGHPWGQCHSPALVLEAAEAQAGVQPQRDLRQHVRQLLLHQLVPGQRAPKLLPAGQGRGALSFGGG